MALMPHLLRTKQYKHLAFTSVHSKGSDRVKALDLLRYANMSSLVILTRHIEEFRLYYVLMTVAPISHRNVKCTAALSKNLMVVVAFGNA
jgi:hypothetical protein